MSIKKISAALPTMAVRQFKLMLLLALTSVSVRAHDPMDITAQARFLPEGLELRLTLAWSTACQLIAEDRAASNLRPENFPEIRPLFQQRAASFLRVTVGDKILVPQSVTTDLSYDGDVKLILQFSPATSPRIRFEAALLRVLPQDCTVFLLIRGPAPTQFAQGRMTSERPRFEINDASH